MAELSRPPRLTARLFRTVLKWWCVCVCFFFKFINQLLYKKNKQTKKPVA